MRASARTIGVRWLTMVMWIGCAGAPPDRTDRTDRTVPASGLIEGANLSLRIADGRIVERLAGSGDGFIAPPVIDSHVHLAYWSVADQLAGHGVLGVVDLAAPIDDLPRDTRVDVMTSGPMLTSPGGYPLDSWGARGFGVGCADRACVDTVIDRHAAAGARVVKLALDDGGLDHALAAHAVTIAHRRGFKVAAHALTDRAARVAARIGVDVLAHTPVEPLAPDTVQLWKHGAVISSLAAFGGSSAALSNLRALHRAGARVLYGTDLGNLREPGISQDELSLLAAAGLTDREIFSAMTEVPARFWGFNLGTAVGQPATVIVYRREPTGLGIGHPDQIWVRGQRLR